MRSSNFYEREKPMLTIQHNTETIPLCVDLDGTLVKTNLLWESMLQLVKRNPLYAVALPFWLLCGRACLKTQIAKHTQLDVAALPYNEDFVKFLREEHRSGRQLILATASHRLLAEPLAAHLGFFVEVIASDDQLNLRSHAKAARLVERFGRQGFDYAGNSAADLEVWREARQALVVDGSKRLLRQLHDTPRTFASEHRPLQQLIRLLRPHQWMKNLIIFVPLVTDHKLGNLQLLRDAGLAFAAFSLCASGLYVLNDLLDIDADRQHAGKKRRPFAAGELPLWLGFALVPLLLAGAAAVSLTLPLGFALALVTYFALNTLYSWRIKRVVLLDVFCLAALYTLRLISGHEATHVAYSAWLLVFAMFIFLSLALVKRFQELYALRRENRSHAKGRGYAAGDLELVASLGSISGYMAVLVLALYVNSDKVRTLYQHPLGLLLICPLLLYWVSRVWLLAHRGELHDDLVSFATSDWVSYLVGILTLVVMFLATGP